MSPVYNNCADCDAIFGSKHGNSKRCNICRTKRKKIYSQQVMQRTYFKTEIEKAKKKTPRKCMSCQVKFPSEGKHNRMCSDCRGRN